MLSTLGIVSQWVFPDENGEMLNSSHLYSMWDTYRNQHQLGCSLHELRHPYVKPTTKNKSLQKQKSQATKHTDSLGFALLLLLTLKRDS